MKRHSGMFKPGNKIGMATRWKPGTNPKRKAKPSLLQELERLAHETKVVKLADGSRVEMTYLELAAMTYWKKVMRGDFNHSKLMLAYFDGQPPQAPDPSLMRTPEDNARLIMRALSEMDARNNGHNGTAADTSDGALVSTSAAPGSSRLPEEPGALQCGSSGTEVIQDGDGEEAGHPQGSQ